MSSPTPSSSATPSRVAGLDTLRFFCALMVAAGHVGCVSPGLAAHFPPILRSVGGVLGNGPAAVIVFFVISGFCIHYPFRNGSSPFIPEYLCRRFVRIALPMAVAGALAARIGASIPAWSLYPEMIYYALYPFIFLPAARKFGWKAMIVVSFLAAAALVATDPRAQDYPSFHSWNWLLALPCWLVGCWLAEEPIDVGTRASPWGWRLGTWGATAVLQVLRFHASIGYPVTFDFFALLVAAWLKREIAYWRGARGLGWLEAAGRASYSLYLVHMTGDALPVALGLALAGTSHLVWSYLCVGVVTVLFFRLVELPSQNLAKWMGARARRASSDARETPGRRAA